MLNTGTPLDKSKISGSNTKLIYSKKASIIINDIDVAKAAALPVCFKNNVVINKIEKNMNSIM